MKNIKRVESILTGYIGESYVIYELAKKGIKLQRVDNLVASYDFLASNGLKIEVKSSKPTWNYNGAKTHRNLTWIWNNAKNNYEYKGMTQIMKTIPFDRKCDFFIFVGMDNKGNTKRVFIVPAEIVGTRKSIQEPVNRKRDGGQGSFRIYQYENKWDLITKHENEQI
jgi:hypothetical protein